MKQALLALTLLIAGSFVSACSDDPALFILPIDVVEEFGNGASKATADSHWYTSGTGSIDFAISFYADGTCEIGVSASDSPFHTGSKTGNFPDGYRGAWDCEWTALSLTTIELLVEGEVGDIVVTLSDIEIAEEGGTWTVEVDHEEMDAPADFTMAICGVAMNSSDPDPGTNCDPG